MDLKDAVIFLTCNHDFLLIIFFVFYLLLLDFKNFSSEGESFDLLVSPIIYCVGAGISTLMSTSDGLAPYLFCRKMEKTRSVREDMNGKVYISRQSRHSFVNNMIKLLFPICTLTWPVNNYVSRQGKGINRRKESTIIIINYDFGTVEVIFFALHLILAVADFETISLLRREVNFL